MGALLTSPDFAASGLTGATQASRYVGATASGALGSGTFAVGDFVIDQTGKVWVCTVAGSPGTFVAAGATLDATPSDFQPDGIGAAGSTTKAADAGHVHPEQAFQSLLTAPTGALSETYPRALIGGSNQSSVTANAFFTAIGLPKGVTVANITLITGTSAESGGTHAWVALTDSAFKVLAVSSDQTGTTYFSPTNTAVTTALGSSYLTTAAGVYYVVQCVVATGAPNFAGTTVGPSGNVTPNQSLVLAGQSTPPAVNATLAPSSGTKLFYAYLT
jgi:hypothetical protein